MTFQFTHPVRGATPTPTPPSRRPLSFNSRTPCGVRLLASYPACRLDLFQFTHPVRGATPPAHRQAGRLQVSIHAPRAGCDAGAEQQGAIFRVSIHAPRAGCDPRATFLEALKDVSIHAPRAGCDCRTAMAQCLRCRFNSRTPCGVRLVAWVSLEILLLFQFTHPVRGAT